jgi:hypothetical protein
LRAVRSPLLAGCIALGAEQASAQNAMVNPDPFAPKLESNPLKPPRFQKSRKPALAQQTPLPAFVPPASGAGDTGFDSTNSRKKTKAKLKGKSVAQPSALANQPVPPPVSPYQVPPPGEENAALAAAPPGHAAGRTDRADRQAGEEAQGAFRAGRPLRAARHPRRCPSICFRRSNSPVATAAILANRTIRRAPRFTPSCPS